MEHGEDKRMTSKERAALKAAELVESGMVLGLGTGSTATLIVREIGRRMRAGELRNLRGVPTSEAIARVAREEGIDLVPLEETDGCDLTLDGADEVDPSWNLIKGAGGSLLREKIVAQSSRLEAIVIDRSKLVERLGSRMPLPIEVVPFGWSSHLEFLRSLGGVPELRRTADGRPFRTDEGNYTLDVGFLLSGESTASSPGSTHALADPRALDQRLRRRAGIVETGLFLGLTSILVIGGDEGAEILRKESRG